MADNSWMQREIRPRIDLRIDVPHGARIYDWLLGGKTNYAPDRAAAAELVRLLPGARRTALENRAFMHRAVRAVIAEGVTQFLDIGTGIPTQPNLHETAQGLVPSARVVYADNDPIVLVHSRALHASTPEGATAYVQADIREPDSILGHEELAATLDMTKPVALTLLTVLHWLPDSADPHDLVRRYIDALPSGSFLVISHITTDLDAKSVGDAAHSLNGQGSNVQPRTRERVAAFFDGLDLIDPGLTLVEDWRPDTDSAVPVLSGGEAPAIPVPVYVGVARKP